MRNLTAVRGQLLALARDALAAQREACGLLAAEPSGDWTVWPVPNVLAPKVLAPHVLVPAPATPAGFAMDPVALQQALRACEARGARLAAFWHSHPGSSALPSSADRYAAWQGVPFYICAPCAQPALRAWVWSGESSSDCFRETPLEGEDTPTLTTPRA
jgi:proteasome lid subunit RPN8/RPN11